MREAKFKIWYGDGSTYTDQDGRPEDAPKVNVQFIAVEDDMHGMGLCRNSDFYVWDFYDGMWGWQGVDRWGFQDYMEQPGLKLVLFGRTLGNVEYSEMLSKALHDDYLPQKTAYMPGELRKDEW